MTPSRICESRFLVTLAASVLACAGLACEQPKVMGDTNVDRGAGGSRSGAGGSGNQGGAGGNPGAGGASGAGGSFTIPDASTTPPSDAAVNNPGANQCAGEAHDGKILPLDLFFLVDISGSMGDLAGGKTKWVAVRDALATFLKDGQSAGLGVGLQFFPPPAKRCTANADCGGGLFGGGCEQRGACAAPAMVMQTTRSCNALNATMCSGGLGGVAQPCTMVGQCAKTGLWCAGMGTACPGGMAGDTCQPRPAICTANSVQLCDTGFYAAPAVTFADLPGNEAKLTTALMDVVPNGSTPTTPAVQGALMHLRTRAMADPTRKPVLLLATDGLPQGCAPMNSVALAAGHLSTAFMSPGAASIPTYVIGVFAPEEIAEAEPALMQLAAAGGTGVPFVLTAGQDLGQRFIDALNAIRGRALGCEFMIPTPKMGAIDFKKVNVRMTGAGMSGQDLSYVGSADKCDPTRGGWYYDVDPATGTPTRVRLCETTCNQVKNGADARVELVFGCVTKVD